MKQVIMKRGSVQVDEVPSPSVEAGSILIDVEYSCISVGTETQQLKAQKVPLWKRAIEKPKKAKEMVQKAMTEGIFEVLDEIDRKLNAGVPTGYSVAGRVVECGNDITDFKKGDRIAAAGSQYAHHAERVSVTQNLCVRIPEAVEVSAASTVALGSIALQGIRRANPTLGETFVVVGLGVLGQLSAQMLKANGCRVIGIDLDESRAKVAQDHGISFTVDPQASAVEQIRSVFMATGGIGADGVIITAASKSSELVSASFQMCRPKGRVILVGDVGLDLDRADLFPKELDFLISTSYGPGRYDPRYEEQGLDYPVGYVRWTENRNMSAYLELLAEKKISLEGLISRIFPVSEAPEAFSSLNSAAEKPLFVLLSYPVEKFGPEFIRIENSSLRKKAPSPGALSLAVVGAGNFAKAVHLPNLRKLSKSFRLHTLVSRSGVNASEVAKQFQFEGSTTSFESVLADPNIQAVLISSRHHLHAQMTLQALQAGKHILVEKPLAIHSSELTKIKNFFSPKDIQAKPILFTGFNRRFSPFMDRIKKMIESRKNPIICNYVMNAQFIPLDSWVHGAEGGGRNIGEACHIYDLFTFLTNADPEKVTAISIRPSASPDSKYYSARDNFVAVIRFSDGSVCQLTYSALGSPGYPKEKMTLFSEGSVFEMEDYKKLTFISNSGKKQEWKASQDKGHEQELKAFYESCQSGANLMPIWQQIHATEISFEVEKLLSL